MLTVLLIIANLLAYGLELAAGGYPACEAFGLVPSRFVETREISPFLTSLFLHDPDNLVHLGGNLLFLACFGPVVERKIGAFKFGCLYTLAGAAGGLLHVVADPSATHPLVGASSAVFGILAVAGTLRPRLLPFAFSLGGLEVWHAFNGGSGNVSFACHLGGLAAGVVVAWALRAYGDEELEVA